MHQAVKILPIVIVLSLFLASCSSSVRFRTDKSGSSNKIYTERNNNDNHNAAQRTIEYPSDDLALRIINEAESWIGVPYKYGGEDRLGADCSGFVWNVFSSIGFALPRTAHQQYQFAMPINRNELRTSDLIFFSNDPTVDHVGIYVGNNNFIHASTSKGVIISSLSQNYYSARIRGFGRIAGIY